MTSISKSFYVDELDNIVNEYSNILHSTIKMVLANGKSSTYFDFSIQNNDQKVTLQIGLKKLLRLK